MRKAAQIAGAAAIAAMLLSGCGSSSEGDEESKPSQSADGADKPASGIDGAWQSKSANGTVTLAVIGESATLSTGKTACQGTVQDMGTTMLALKCSDGDDTRSMGTVKQTGDKLTVSWKNGPTEEFTKTEGKVEIPKPDLPSGTN
ncbi:hypothetical protein [Streptomyces ochraceiscleroticus]|uniref:Lipoprotein n=1 Tax=Streptomyces ochraceiscleroticus TaxID=47761 RepID=A0ABW1MUQ4_9ACTN|nr:hypothetical protein [Streptomyces ochraceiscleroticus]